MTVERQKVTRCPKTGRTIWIYEDRGPAKGIELRGNELGVAHSLNSNRSALTNHGRMRGTGLSA